MCHIHVESRVIDVPKGTLLSDTLRNAGAHPAMPCAGRGTCGKCAVYVRGEVDDVSAKENGFLSVLPLDASLLEGGYQLRLACFAKVLGDCDVRIPSEQVAVEISTETALPRYDGDETLALGFAIDIGTTTVALQLYDLPTSTLLSTHGEANRQGAFGADVLSRIAYADANGQQAPSDAIRQQLSQHMQAMLEEVQRSAEDIRRLVITGNTTMLHFLCGLDPHGIGQSPFIPESLFGTESTAVNLFPFLPPHATLYLPRCVSAYVGADITCGMLAASMDVTGDKALLVDVGTNGEMALRAGDSLYCCATAAGPAFEGMQISMGMSAIPGAISRVWAEGRSIRYATIAGVPPNGICGTGLISAIRAMLETGALDATGLMDDDTFPIADSGVSLTARDIREVQLAKAAIGAGIDTLLHSANLTPAALDAVWLAGGFGSVLDPADAAAIGLIPQRLSVKAKARGNLALSGAAQMLFSVTCRNEGEALAKAALEVPLATNSYFMDRYIEQMMFPED